MAHGDVDYAPKGRKPQRTRCQKICRAIYNPDKKALFGRTCGSWAKIGLFYGVYYSCLAGFFAAMMFGFFTTLNEVSPTQKGMYSLIKQNPGMGFRPLQAIESTLIHINVSDEASYSKKIEDILQYLRENNYIDADNKSIDVPEKDSNGKPVFNFGSHFGPGSPCSIDLGNLNNSFGYAAGQPCVLLKVNRVYDWTPVAFDNASLDTDHGRDAVKALRGKTPSPDHIDLTCEGENDGDLDNMGEILFIPEGGFPYTYFPYLNANEYRPPLVFVKFLKPTKGSLLQIWCKLWAANIKIHKNDKAGSARFELLVDEKKQQQ